MEGGRLIKGQDTQPGKLETDLSGGGVKALFFRFLLVFCIF